MTALRYEVLTPPGRGAVATIAVAGSTAGEALTRYFQSATKLSLSQAPLDRIVFGRWQRAANQAGEELVVCRTAEDRYEIHCHGGAAAIEAITSDLAACGGIAVEGLTTQHCQAYALQALEALQHARTERTAAILLDQYRGAFERESQAIVALLAHNDHITARQRIDRLLALWPIGQHLTQPFRVVLAGPPNVGKSSLINALLGYDRAIVFDQPGTTRDVVSAVTALAGWPVELSDTAGLRDTGDVLEAAGVHRARQQLATADLVLWVRDCTQLPLSEDSSPPEGLVPAPLLVWNKSDLPSASSQAARSDVVVSARTGAGLGALQHAIVARLVPQPPLPGEAVPYREPHYRQLQQWRQQLGGY